MCCCPSTSTPAPMKTPAAWKRISRIQPQAARMRASLPGWKTPTEDIREIRDPLPPRRRFAVRNPACLADTVQKCTLSVMKEKTFTVRDGGVKSGPFKVLLGANIPGILVEVGYCSNAQESRQPCDTHVSAGVGGRDRFRHPCPFGQPRREQALIPFPYAFFPVWQFSSQPCAPLPLSCALRKKRKRCSVLLE